MVFLEGRGSVPHVVPGLAPHTGLAAGAAHPGPRAAHLKCESLGPTMPKEQSRISHRAGNRAFDFQSGCNN